MARLQRRRKEHLLLHCAGMSVQDIFETPPNKEVNYDDAARALGGYFRPKLNHKCERHLFHQLQQKVGETTDQFIICRRQQAMNCNFGDQEDDSIRDQVIDKCVDRRLKGKYQEKGTLTVAQLQEIARAHEAAQ